MMNNLRDFGIVVAHDLMDSYRSRRAGLWILLFLLTLSIGTYGFIFTVSKIEDQMSSMTHSSVPRKPGTMTTSLWKSETFFNLMTSFVGDENLARSLVNTPPLALFYGWFALYLSPLLVIIVSSESIAADVSSGAARFMLFRTSRLSWCAGKAVGQAILTAFALALGGMAAWCIGAVGMASYPMMATAAYIFVFTVKAWFYTLAFLGLALGVSQLTRSAVSSHFFGILAYLFVVIISRVADYRATADSGKIWELVYLITPQSHIMDFWRPRVMEWGTAACFTTMLGCLYFSAGFFFLNRKDV